MVLAVILKYIFCIIIVLLIIALAFSFAAWVFKVISKKTFGIVVSVCLVSYFLIGFIIFPFMPLPKLIKEKQILAVSEIMDDESFIDDFQNVFDRAETESTVDNEYFFGEYYDFASYDNDVVLYCTVHLYPPDTDMDNILNQYKKMNSEYYVSIKKTDGISYINTPVRYADDCRLITILGPWFPSRNLDPFFGCFKTNYFKILIIQKDNVVLEFLEESENGKSIINKTVNEIISMQK